MRLDAFEPSAGASHDTQYAEARAWIRRYMIMEMDITELNEQLIMVAGVELLKQKPPYDAMAAIDKACRALRLVIR